MLSHRDLFWVMLVAFTWALHAPIIKLGVQEIDPFMLALIRFLFTGLLFLPFAGKITRDDFIKLIPVSLFFVSGNLLLINLALHYISSNSFIVIIQFAQPITILLAYFLFKEKFGLPTTLGILMSMIGLIIVFGAPDILSSPIGALITILAATSWSLGSLAMKKTGHIKPASFLSYSYLMGVPIALLVTGLFEDNQITEIINADKSNLIFVVLYQILVMSAITFVWSGLMVRNPAQFVTPFLMLQPIFAVIASYYMFGETLNQNILCGGLVVMSGIGIINFRKIQRYKKDS